MEKIYKFMGELVGNLIGIALILIFLTGIIFIAGAVGYFIGGLIVLLLTGSTNSWTFFNGIELGTLILIFIYIKSKIREKKERKIDGE